MFDFSKSLDIALSSENAEGWNNLQQALELSHKLSKLKQQALDIQHKLGCYKHKLNADLASAVRRKFPNLDIKLSKLGCGIGYKSKSLIFNPDIRSGVWKVNSTDKSFRNGFLKSVNHNIELTENLSQMVDSIISFFVAYYKTLHEELAGPGEIIVEGQNATLRGITDWSLNVAKILPSRSTRHAQST